MLDMRAFGPPVNTVNDFAAEKNSKSRDFLTLAPRELPGTKRRRGRQRIERPELRRGTSTGTAHKRALADAALLTLRTPRKLRPAVKEHALQMAARDGRLTRSALAVFSDVCRLVFWEHGHTTTSAVKGTAARTGVSVRTVNRCFKLLECCGHITRFTKRQTSKVHCVGLVAALRLNEASYRSEAARKEAEKSARKAVGGSDRQITTGSDRQITGGSDEQTTLTIVPSTHGQSTHVSKGKNQASGEAQSEEAQQQTKGASLGADRANGLPSVSPLRSRDQSPPASDRPSAKTIESVRRSAKHRGHDPDTAERSTWDVYNAGRIGRGKNPDDRFHACWASQLSTATRQRPAGGFQSIGLAASRAIGGGV
jgi:hypothetical protein